MSLPSTTRSPYEEAHIIKTELDYNVGEQLEIVGRDVPSLNSDQRNVLGAVMAVINDPEPYSKVFFVDGPRGTGKTFFLCNTLLAQVRSLGEIALGVASIGISALLLQGGRTVHSRLKIPFNTNELSVCDISKQSALARLLKSAKLFGLG